MAGCAAGAPPEKVLDHLDSGVGQGGHGGTSGNGGSGGSGGSSGSGGMSGRDGGAGSGGTNAGSGGMSGSGSGGTSGNDGGPNDSGTDSGPMIGDCDDDEKNGSETDTDCGGSICDPCPDGDTCLEDDDCEDGACNGSFQCQAPACDDGEQNGDETDQDCGGSCDTKCANSKKCEGDDDCMSGACNDGTKLCECAATDMTTACMGIACGQVSNGCGGMIDCPITCDTDQACEGNTCVDTPMCDSDTCMNSCDFLQVKCCESDGTCGCRPFWSSSCG